MSSDPKPEHRISNLEKEFLHLGTRIEEAASDNAEEFKAIRQEIKGLDEGMRSSFTQIGDTLIAIEESLETAKTTMATKDDISRLETRLDTMATKDDLSQLRNEVKSEMTAMKNEILDAMKQLLQQKGE